jgi:hypothetical protein
MSRPPSRFPLKSQPKAPASSVPRQQAPSRPHQKSPRPAVAQPKTAAPFQKPRPPVAPPVYRPQPTPKVLQRKSANNQPQPGASQPRRAPAAPPPYRPQPRPPALQRKSHPQAPPVYRPQPPPKVLQPKTALELNQQLRSGVAQPPARVLQPKAASPGKAHPGQVNHPHAAPAARQPWKGVIQRVKLKDEVVRKIVEETRPDENQPMKDYVPNKLIPKFRKIGQDGWKDNYNEAMKCVRDLYYKEEAEEVLSKVKRKQEETSSATLSEEEAKKQRVTPTEVINSNSAASTSINNNNSSASTGVNTSSPTPQVAAPVPKSVATGNVLGMLFYNEKSDLGCMNSVIKEITSDAKSMRALQEMLTTSEELNFGGEKSYPKQLVAGMASEWLGMKVTEGLEQMQNRHLTVGVDKITLGYRPPKFKKAQQEYNGNLEISVNGRKVLNYHVYWNKC